jgi:hypothetical protein
MISQIALKNDGTALPVWLEHSVDVDFFIPVTKATNAFVGLHSFRLDANDYHNSATEAFDISVLLNLPPHMPSQLTN